MVSDKIIKILADNKKGRVIEKTFKPRHGLRMHCPYCGWTFRGGGYITKTEAKRVEREQKEIHLQGHKKHPLLSVRKYADPAKSLQIERDFHAAEIPHAFQQVAPINAVDRPTTTSTTYVDVAGASIASGSFAANQDHYVVVTAQLDAATANTTDCGVRMVLGASNTVIADSEANYDPPLATTSDLGHRMLYNWWGIVNTANAQLIKMQIKSGDAADTVGVDLVTISVIRLSADLTPNVDYKYSLNSTPTDITAEATDTASNNASISLTPPTAGQIWLISSKARYATGIRSNTGVNSRISHSGGASSAVPEMQQEGEDSMTSSEPACMYILTGMRTDTLSATSQTYTEISKAVNTDAANPGITAVTRTHSGIFMLNLTGSFRNVATNQEDTPQEDFSTTTPYGQLIHSDQITLSQAGDVMFLSHTTMNAAVAGTNTRFWQMRMQVGQTDQPPNQTSKEYKLAQWDAADKLPIMFGTIENLSAATYTTDIDGNTGEIGSNRATLYRNITAFSMEMSGTARTLLVTEPITMTENINLIKGVARKILVTEPITMTENIGVSTSSSANFLQSENLQLRLSGGSSNVDPHSSLGGIMSQVIPGEGAGSEVFVPADFVAADFEITTSVTEVEGAFTSTGFTASGFLIAYEVSSFLHLTLFDDVGLSEALAGDIEYRCVYLYNAHPTLTMFDTRIWISTNTPSTSDAVQIGLGTSAVGGTEQTIANENAVPSGVGFSSTANSLATAIQCGDIPAGQHRAIWVKRDVSAGAATYLGNNYFLSAHFYSNFVSS